VARVALPDGVHYNVEAAGAGPALVLLHGFTGSAAGWREHAGVLSARFSVAAIDLLGHGGSDSPPDPARYRMERCTDDLGQILDRLGLGAIHLLGYSMGGRAALNFGLAHPERVRSLILESGSPGLAGEAERAARTAADEALAAQIEDEGVEAFVDGWERLPLFASQARIPETARAALRDGRLRNNPLGLANSLRGMGTGVQAEVWSRLPDLRLPVLLMAGSLDTKFSAIARQMAGRIPGASLAIVPDAGHTVHLEQPAEFDRLVLAFLNERNAA
jgi:2-succinyl-6-hydroxy-2,4-cyclohexadiene-1-carboxylate synthase